MKLYLCGGSTELDLVSETMRQLRAMGHEITHDWVANIRDVGHANPRDASHEARLRWSAEDLDGIDRADLVWAMLPARASFGCAFESGFAIGSGKTVIMSGDWRASIFSAQAYARFNEHAHAVEWVRLYTTPGEWEDEMGALEAT